MSKRTNPANKPQEWAVIIPELLKRYGNKLTPNYRSQLERMKEEAEAEIRRYGKSNSTIWQVKAANE